MSVWSVAMQIIKAFFDAMLVASLGWIPIWGIIIFALGWWVDLEAWGMNLFYVSLGIAYIIAFFEILMEGQEYEEEK